MTGCNGIGPALSWKPKAFISYSKANLRQRDRLVNQLKILANEGLLDEYWHDRMIIPGEDWHARIQEELNEADLIILLLSSDALSTDYITQHEIPLALARHDSKQAHFVPVIVEACRWTQCNTGSGTQLKDLNALPEKGKPIAEWKPSQAKGWTSVGDGLARVLEVILQSTERRDGQNGRDGHGRRDGQNGRDGHGRRGGRDDRERAHTSRL